jgi:hypothetical protein
MRWMWLVALGPLVLFSAALGQPVGSGTSGAPKTALGGERYLIWLVIFLACVAAVGWFFARRRTSGAGATSASGGSSKTPPGTGVYDTAKRGDKS